MKQIKMSAEKLQVVIDSFIAIVESIKDEDVRTPIMTLVEELGERLFAAPVSNKLEYHNCFVGGLAEHSLRVYGNLMILRNEFYPDISKDSVALVALMHDLGKVGSIDCDYYIPHTSQWHKDKLGMMYEHNPELDFLGTAQRSLRLLSQYRVPLTDEEYKAILIHDGQYIPENKPYSHKEGALGLLLHQADMLACKVEKDKWLAVQ